MARVGLSGVRREGLGTRGLRTVVHRNPRPNVICAGSWPGPLQSAHLRWIGLGTGAFPHPLAINRRRGGDTCAYRKSSPAYRSYSRYRIKSKSVNIERVATEGQLSYSQ
jgi:hypothetical protein